MRVHEAKDFLVEQIKRQAAYEGVSLSNLEIEMLYFTERGGLSEKMQETVEEFDQSYNTPEYEKKISRLMKHAYAQLKKNDPVAKLMWDDAIRVLKKGDHYILVMWGGVKPLALAVVVGAVFLTIALFAGLRWVASRFPPPNPHLLLGVFVGIIAFALLFQHPHGRMFGWIAENTFLRFLRSKEEKEE